MSVERVKRSVRLPGVVLRPERSAVPEAVLELQMYQAVLEHIKLPDVNDHELPQIIIVAGPCRTGTGALATALNRSEIVRVAHIQPHKTVRRNTYSLILTDQEINYKRLTLNIEPGNHVEVIKETLGPKTSAEFFNLLLPLLRAGYPSEKLIFVPTFRDPLETFDSTVRMWGLNYITPDSINQSFVWTMQVMEMAKEVGIPVVPYVLELLRDYQPGAVMEALFPMVGVPYQEELVKWGENDAYEKTITYEIPPLKFIEGSVNLKRGGRGGLVWKPLQMVLAPEEQREIQPQLSPAYAIYEEVFTEAKMVLGW
jgi:hypothetical protein